MKAPYSGEPGEDWHLGDGPFYFSGPPDQCQGEVEVCNCCDHKIKIRQLEVLPATRLRKDAQTLDAGFLKMDARVQAGETRRLRARLAIPPETPPGEYDVSVQFGRKRRQLRVTIDANRAFMTSPSHLKVSGAEGDTIQQVVLLENRGNVPIEISGGSMVWLREREWIGRTLVYALRETGDTDDYHAFANRLLSSFKSSMVPPASVKLSPAGSFALKSNESVKKTLSITLPQGLQKGRHYLGFIKMADDRLWLEVYCNGASASSKRR